LKRDYWIVRDYVNTPVSHDIKAYYHFDSSVEPLHSKGNNVRVFSENGHRAVLQIASFADGSGEWIAEKGWVSHCYGEKEVAPVFAFSVIAKNSVELVTFLLPEEVGGNAKPNAREIEALHGQAFEVNFNGMHDVLMLSDQINDGYCSVETVRFRSDFELAWARFHEADARTPEELVLLNGHTLEFEGRTLLRSRKRIPYLVARRVGDRFRVETEDGVLEIDLPVTDLEALLGNVDQRSNSVSKLHRLEAGS